VDEPRLPVPPINDSSSRSLRIRSQVNPKSLLAVTLTRTETPKAAFCVPTRCPHRCGMGLTAAGPPLSGRCDAWQGYPLTVRRNGAVMKIIQGTTFAGLVARR
jgi:hypothetical protein